MDNVESRPCDRQNSDKPDPDRGPAAHAHPFVEDRPRQGSHEEWRRKRNGENLIEPEIFEGEKVQERRAQQQGRPADLEYRSCGAQQAWAAQRIGHDKGEQERKSVARPYDLKHIDLAAEIFCGRMEECKRADRAAHENNADETGTTDRRGAWTSVTLWGSNIRHRSVAIALSCQRRSTRYDKSDSARTITIPVMDSRISAANMRGILSR